MMPSKIGGTCRETAQNISDYIDGKTPLLRRARIWFHLKQCPPCEKWLGSLRATLQAVQSARNGERKIEVPPELKSRIENIFKS